MIYAFHYDAGHGWLKVSRATLAKAGLAVTDFSTCSYLDDEFMYLEEDLDAGVFVERFMEITGYKPEVNEVYDGSHSPIRDKRHNTGSKQ